jgi:hypothetical protein
MGDAFSSPLLRPRDRRYADHTRCPRSDKSAAAKGRRGTRREALRRLRHDVEAARIPLAEPEDSEVDVERERPRKGFEIARPLCAIST